MKKRVHPKAERAGLGGAGNSMESALGTDLLTRYELARDHLLGITSGLPTTSEAYVNARPREVEITRLPYGVSTSQVSIALQLWDVHTLLSAFRLTSLWRVRQLVSAADHALYGSELIVASALVRSLVETAASLVVEGQNLALIWQRNRKRAIESPSAATEVRFELVPELLQVMIGSKQEQLKIKGTRLERKNVLTLLKKAAKLTGADDLNTDYGRLCDAVHPSFESGASFWDEVGIWEEAVQLRILFNQHAMRPRELASTVAGMAIWASTTAASGFDVLKSAADDMCLTLKLPQVLATVGSPLDYFGLLPDTKPQEPCPCGSDTVSARCLHRLDEVLTMLNLPVQK